MTKMCRVTRLKPYLQLSIYTGLAIVYETLNEIINKLLQHYP
jgi:hypothetical protein